MLELVLEGQARPWELSVSFDKQPVFFKVWGFDSVPWIHQLRRCVQFGHFQSPHD